MFSKERPLWSTLDYLFSLISTFPDNLWLIRPYLLAFSRLSIFIYCHLEWLSTHPKMFLLAMSCILLPSLGGGSPSPFYPSVWFRVPHYIIIACLLTRLYTLHISFGEQVLCYLHLSRCQESTTWYAHTQKHALKKLKLKVCLLQDLTSSNKSVLFDQNWCFPFPNSIVLLSERLSN